MNLPEFLEHVGPIPNNVCALTWRVDPEGPGRSVLVFSAHVLRGWDNVPAATEILKDAVLNFPYRERYATSKELILTAKIHVTEGVPVRMDAQIPISNDERADMLNGRIRRNRISYNKLRDRVRATMKNLLDGPVHRDIFSTTEPITGRDLAAMNQLSTDFTTMHTLQQAILSDLSALREIGGMPVS